MNICCSQSSQKQRNTYFQMFLAMFWFLKRQRGKLITLCFHGPLHNNLHANSFSSKGHKNKIRKKQKRKIVLRINVETVNMHKLSKLLTSRSVNADLCLWVAAVNSVGSFCQLSRALTNWINWQLITAFASCQQLWTLWPSFKSTSQEWVSDMCR